MRTILLCTAILAAPLTVANVVVGGDLRPCHSVIGARIAASAHELNGNPFQGLALAIATTRGPEILAARDGHIACQGEVFSLLAAKLRARQR